MWRSTTKFKLLPSFRLYYSVITECSSKIKYNVRPPICSEQDELKARLVEVDSEEVLSWRSVDDQFSQLHHVAGVDISFGKESPSQACAMITILNFPQLEVGKSLIKLMCKVLA